MPSEGPAGRSIETSPQTSILAAVTQALPGPTMRSTGASPAPGRPYASAPIGLGAARHDERVDLEQAGGAEQDRVAGAVGGGRRGDHDPVHARDAGRDDGHDDRRRVRGRAAGDVRADRGERGPAALDLDAGTDRRARRGRALRLGEPPDVRDRLVERAADAWLERVAGGPQVIGIEHQPAVGPPAADAGVGVADRVVAAPPDVLSVALAASRTSVAGTAPRRTSASRAATASGTPASTAARSRRRSASVAVVTGRSSRSAARGCPTRRRP